MEELKTVVNDLNVLFGSEYYLPIELVYTGGVYYIKAFGKITWDSDNWGEVTDIHNFVMRDIDRIVKPIRLAVIMDIEDTLRYIPNVSTVSDLKTEMQEVFDEYKES